MGSDSGNQISDIVFGLNREEDERSLASFLDHFSGEKLVSVLIPRMSDDEISETLHFLTGLMRRHLSKKEYHALFLGEKKHPH